MALSLIKGKVSLFRSGSGRQLFSGSGRVGEEFTNRPVMQHYGFASSLPVGTDALILKQGESVYLIASDHRKYRIELGPEEVALFDSRGSKVHLKEGGKIEIESSFEVRLKTEKAVIEAGTIYLGGEAMAEVGGGVVTQKCVCAATGATHVIGSSSVKAKLKNWLLNGPDCGVKVKRYESLTAVHCALWECTEDDLLRGTLGGTDLGGVTTEHSYSEVLEAGRLAGVFGFTDGETIHYWADEGVALEMLVRFFGHELGHMTGTACEDDMAEEMRAEEYSAVAVKALELANMVTKEAD